MTTERVLNSQKENNDFGETRKEPKANFHVSDVLETIHQIDKINLSQKEEIVQ